MEKVGGGSSYTRTRAFHHAGSCKEGRTKACGMYSSAFVPGQILHRLLQRAQKADCILGRGVCVCGGPAARFLCRVWQSQASFAISPSHVGATNLQLTYCSDSRAYLFSEEYSSWASFSATLLFSAILNLLWLGRVTRVEFVCFSVLNPKVSSLHPFQERSLTSRKKTLRKRERIVNETFVVSCSVQNINCYIMLYPQLVVKQGKTFTSPPKEHFLCLPLIITTESRDVLRRR